MVREIGKGAYGTAFMVQERTTGQRYVLKVRRCSGLCREQQALSQPWRLTTAELSAAHNSLRGPQKVRLARQSHKERQASLRELQLLCSLCHRNILSCKEAT